MVTGLLYISSKQKHNTALYLDELSFALSEGSRRKETWPLNLAADYIIIQKHHVCGF